MDPTATPQRHDLARRRSRPSLAAVVQASAVLAAAVRAASLRAGLAAIVLACGLLFAACGGTDEVAPPDDLSPAAAEGWTVAATKGCMSCHGRDGVGGTGPEWIGLAGSDRQLIDGTVVVADRDYLVRSLVDPQAERVSGFNILMPTVELTDAEIDAIIDYIEAIA